MDAKEKMKKDLREGRLDPETLVDLVFQLQETLGRAERRIEELERKLKGFSKAETAEPYSLRAEEKRQLERGEKKERKTPLGRRGRIGSAEKIALADRREAVFPSGVAESECVLSHVRPAWRLENNQTVLVAYEIYRGPGNRYGKIPGILGRSEFGLEIGLAVAHLIYVTGLSYDKVCLVIGFFQNLRLRKSQVDALLNQLSRHWEQEFETLCTLLSNSAVVHADETSWSLNSVWAFASEKARIFLFGVHKDAQTLEKVLDPATFGGIVVSDHAAVYSKFTKSQKCWAHLLRKAIRLTLQYPTKSEYRQFTDRLLQVYRTACAVQGDGQLNDAGRVLKVSVLKEKLSELCQPGYEAALWTPETLDKDYRLLVNELVELNLADQLFTFVTAAPVTLPNGQSQPVSGTNNEAERTLRPVSEARKTGRTNKTNSGARRQTILTSVLESLRQYLPQFTLATVSKEVQDWAIKGKSCFQKYLAKLKIPLPDTSYLDQLFPKAESPGG
jgi:transposase